MYVTDCALPELPGTSGSVLAGVNTSEIWSPELTVAEKVNGLLVEVSTGSLKVPEAVYASEYVMSWRTTAVPTKGVRVARNVDPVIGGFPFTSWIYTVKETWLPLCT